MIESVFLLLVVLACYAYALHSKDMLASVVAAGAAGMAAAVYFLVLQAPDVAMAQAVVGAGLVPFALVVTLGRTQRFEGKGRKG
jgi:energy-converting hydrogenase B subunit D